MDDELVTCKVCGVASYWDQFDVIGACPGNVFCNHCNAEIDSEGNAAKRCGVCEICQEIQADLGNDVGDIFSYAEQNQ